MSSKENCPTIANRVHSNLPISLAKKQQGSCPLESFRQQLIQIHSQRKQTKNSYERVIGALEQIIEELFLKNDFLTQQRQQLIKQNSELRKKAQSLANIIEMKQRLGESAIVENSQIFQILVESNSVTREMSKNQQSYQFGNTVGNILEENQHIANRQEFIIMSNPLSQNISQIQQNQISMSNIGRTQTVVPANLQTPGLYRQNIFVQCVASKSEGIIRAFYLSIMQKKCTINHLMKIIDSLKHDITTVIYDSYPTNQFWTDMLCSFLKIVHQQHFDNQMEVLQYIKAHRLIDTLIIKCLKSRIEFLFYNTDSFQIPSVVQLLGALSNQFGLRMQVYEGQYVFFTKETKDQNLLLSDRASLQISLNNKEQNKLYVKEQEPTFVILQRNDFLQFSFYIGVQGQLGISQYQINEVPDKQNHSFKYSDENNYSLRLEDNEVEVSGRGDHLEGLAFILNEKDMNIVQNDDKKLNRKFGHKRYGNVSPQQFKQPLNSSRYFLNRVASKNSSFDQNA